MHTNRMKIRVAKLYRDWLNNFLTIERFSEYYNFTIRKSETIINQGRKYHEQGY